MTNKNKITTDIHTADHTGRYSAGYEREKPCGNVRNAQYNFRTKREFLMNWSLKLRSVLIRTTQYNSSVSQNRAENRTRSASAARWTRMGIMPEDATCQKLSICQIMTLSGQKASFQREVPLLRCKTCRYPGGCRESHQCRGYLPLGSRAQHGCCYPDR